MRYAWPCLLVALSLAAISANSLCVIAESGKDSPPDPKQMELFLSEAKILPDSGRKYKVIFDGSSARVNTALFRKATDDDYKITAVLIGKNVVDKCAPKIAQVKVCFSEPESYERVVVEVHKGDVAAFGAKLMNRSDLLASINIIHRRADAETATIMITKQDVGRTVSVLTSHIENLARAGVGVQPFQTLLNNITEMRKNNEPFQKVRSAIIELAKVLDEEEISYREQRHHNSRRKR